LDLCRPNERKRHCAFDCWRYIHRHLYDQHRRHSNCDWSLLALGLCIWRNRGTSLDAASTVWRLRFRPPSRVPAVWAWTFFEVSPAWPRSGHMSLARPFKAGSARPGLVAKRRLRFPCYLSGPLHFLKKPANQRVAIRASFVCPSISARFTPCTAA